MKCECGAWSEIKDTRHAPEGLRRRRHCANGHRFTTLEVRIESVRQSAFHEKTVQARATLRDRGYLL